MRPLSQDEFAYRFSQQELAGWFAKEVGVEEGHLALLLLDGRLDRVLGPGTYTLGSFWGSLFGLGQPRKEVVLVRTGEMPLEFRLSNLLTADPLFLEQECVLTLQYRRGTEAEFLTNLMAGKDRLTFTDLRSLLFAALHDAASGWFSARFLEKLVSSPDLSDLSLALEEAGRKGLTGKGIGVIRAEVRRPAVAAWDEKTRRLADATQQVWQAESELERQKRLAEVNRLLEKEQIVQEETKLAHFQRRAELWERLRQALNSAEMSRLRSERELEDFLRSQDRDKLLKEDDFERFRRTLREKREDEEKTRAHLLRLAEMERDYEYHQLALRQRADLTRSQVEFESGLERLRQQGQFNLERDRLDLEVEKARKEAERGVARHQVEAAERRADELAQAKNRAEIQGLEQESRRLDDELRLALREREQAQERHDRAERDRLERERQERELDLKLKERREELENRLKELRQAHDLEMEQLAAYAKAPIHTLVAISDPTKAPLLAELAALEMKKGMTQEQLLALAAEKNPQVLSYLERATSAKPTSEEEKKLYERIIAEQKEFQSRQQDFYRAVLERYERMSVRAMGAQVEIARALGGGRPPAAPSPVASDEAAAGEGRPTVAFCPRCRVALQPGTVACPNCGEHLLGVA